MAVNLEQELAETSAKLNNAYTEIDELRNLLEMMFGPQKIPAGQKGHIDFMDALAAAKRYYDTHA